MSHLRSQFRFLQLDIAEMTKGKTARLLPVLCSESAAILAWYRLNRGLFLWLGNAWRSARLVLSPFMPIIRLFVSSELDYRAEIGPGLRLLHPQLGYVVGGRCQLGRNVILAGGNCIGDGEVVLGDFVQLGVGSSVVGSVRVGSNVTVGAGAVVTHDFAGPGTLAGVPATPVHVGR